MIKHSVCSKQRKERVISYSAWVVGSTPTAAILLMGMGTNALLDFYS